MQLSIANVTKVYSGKSGCMCGCLGKYTFNEGIEHEPWQGDVNVRSVKIIAKKVLANPKVKFEGNFACVEENGRIKVVYFKDKVDVI